MIRAVTFEKTTYNELPYKFEAGTPDIAGAIGLGAALEYLASLGIDHIMAHERELLAYGTELLESIRGLRLIGTAREKAGVLSFVLEGIHPHDAGTVLDRLGIAVRTGHHCAQPVMERSECLRRRERHWRSTTRNRNWRRWRTASDASRSCLTDERPCGSLSGIDHRP